MKASLTFEEKITAAYLYYVQDVEQQVIAMAMGVNIGRVSEACTAVKGALTPDAPYLALLKKGTASS